MNNTSTDTKRIADEAVGQRPANAIPDVAKDKPVTSDNIRQLARSPGPRASVAARTAEALGEREDGAYAHQEHAPEEVRRREIASFVPRRSSSGEPSLVPLIAAFAIGYSAAVLIHRRT